MLDERIERIGRVVRRNAPVDYPPPLALSPPDGDLVALLSSRLDALRGPNDTEPAFRHVATSVEAQSALFDLARGVRLGDVAWGGRVPGEMREWSIGVTTAALAVAETGSILLALPSAADACVSLLVDRHIVVVGRERLVPNLQALYAWLGEQRDRGLAPHNFVCITGCSRTADIEKLLVAPAHGPRELRLILCDEPIDWEPYSKAAIDLWPVG